MPRFMRFISSLPSTKVAINAVWYVSSRIVSDVYVDINVPSSHIADYVHLFTCVVNGNKRVLQPSCTRHRRWHIDSYFIIVCVGRFC